MLPDPGLTIIYCPQPKMDTCIFRLNFLEKKRRDPMSRVTDIELRRGKNCSQILEII